MNQVTVMYDFTIVTNINGKDMHDVSRFFNDESEGQRWADNMLCIRRAAGFKSKLISKRI
jgi:hypothetical protein